MNKTTPHVEQLEVRDCPSNLPAPTPWISNPSNPWTSMTPPLDPWTAPTSILNEAINSIVQQYSVPPTTYGDVTLPAYNFTPERADNILHHDYFLWWNDEGYVNGTPSQQPPSYLGYPAVAPQSQPIPTILGSQNATNLVVGPTQGAYLTDNGNTGTLAVQTLTILPSSTNAPQLSLGKQVSITSQYDAGTLPLLGFVAAKNQPVVVPATGQLNEDGATLVVSFSVNGVWMYETSSDFGNTWSVPKVTPNVVSSMDIWSSANNALDAAITDVVAKQQ